MVARALLDELTYGAVSRRERPVASHVPYTRHVDDHIIRTRDGLVLTIYKLDGYSFETSDISEVNARLLGRNDIVRTLANSRFALVSHIVRREVQPRIDSTFDNAFCAELDERYNAALSKRRMFVNDLYLTIVRRPLQGQAGTFDMMLTKLLGRKDEAGESVARQTALNELRDVATAVRESLAAYGVRQLGVVNRDGTVTECGRFTPAWCAAYTDAAARGIVTPASSELMRASSPGSVTDRITAPTLISAGESDSLFPLAQANANAQQIMAADPGTPVKVVWHGGGHDGGINESERLDGLAADWFDTHLAGTGSSTTAFELTDTSGSISVQSSGTAPVVLQAPAYPGIFGDRTAPLTLMGPAQRVLAPAGGLPALITSVPGLGGAVGSFIQRPAPGQSAYFQTEPLVEPLTMVGASTVTISVSGAGAEPVEDVTLFASLRIVGPNGRETLPAGLVAPIRLARLGAEPQQVRIELPAVVATAGVGDSLRLVVSTTDFAYRLPLEPRLYDISLADGELAVPLVDAQPVSTGIAPYWWLVGAAVIVALLALLLVRLRPRHGGVAADSVDEPLVISSLTKRYNDDYLAVDDLSFTVGRGMVLGLLGPNGAGKTTTMRMVMGLIMPTSGQIHAFGEAVYAGAPVLSRIGALVEGPGFLPHLTGRQNLDLYWRAAGRSHDDPCLDEVLEIADLGSAIDKKVRTYSQGMRQRLGIAQAMLGKPDLLMLDEPTNGLDPPQIKAMRDVLHRYVESGRTVIISSHMLSEVEQTCTDVVVMHRGRLVGAGSVADLLGDTAGKRLEDVFLEIVGDDLTVGLS